MRAADPGQLYPRTNRALSQRVDASVIGCWVRAEPRTFSRSAPGPMACQSVELLFCDTLY